MILKAVDLLMPMRGKIILVLVSYLDILSSYDFISGVV